MLVGFNVQDPAVCAVYLPKLRQKQFKWFKKDEKIVKENRVLGHLLHANLLANTAERCQRCVPGGLQRF